eukprot:2543241-Amphidinium_carterae.1
MCVAFDPFHFESPASECTYNGHCVLVMRSAFVVNGIAPLHMLHEEPLLIGLLPVIVGKVNMFKGRVSREQGKATVSQSILLLLRDLDARLMI